VWPLTWLLRAKSIYRTRPEIRNAYNSYQWCSQCIFRKAKARPRHSFSRPRQSKAFGKLVKARQGSKVPQGSIKAWKYTAMAVFCTVKAFSHGIFLKARQGIWKIGQGMARQGSKVPQGSLEARHQGQGLHHWFLNTFFHESTNKNVINWLVLFQHLSK